MTKKLFHASNQDVGGDRRESASRPVERPARMSGLGHGFSLVGDNRSSGRDGAFACTAVLAWRMSVIISTWVAMLIRLTVTGSSDALCTPLALTRTAMAAGM